MAVAAYGSRALGLLVLGAALLAVSSSTLTDEGDVKPGVAEAVPFVLIVTGLLAGFFGLFSLLNLVRVAWVLSRHPWERVRATYEEVGKGDFVGSLGTPNGQPVLLIHHGDTRVALTLAAFKWRWQRFAQPELLFAGRSKRAGVVATTDRRAIVWAGRSLATWFLRR